MLKFETIEPQNIADASVILLHGLGADGYDLMSLVPAFHLPATHRIRFIFPHSPVRPITLNGGMTMPGWYDIAGLSLGSREDLTGLEQSRMAIEALLQKEIQSGIQPERIILGGFSQGGALALFTGLQLPYPLAGLAALSAYFPCAKHAMSHLGPYVKHVPIFMANGTQDPIVNYQWGEASRDHLLQAGLTVEWHTYSMAHAICEAEIKDLAVFIKSVLL